MSTTKYIRFHNIRTEDDDYDSDYYYNRFISYTGDLEAGNSTLTMHWFRTDGSYTKYDTGNNLWYYNSTGEINP